MATEQQLWTKSEILELLDCNDKAVWRAVHRLYQLQTPVEQAAEQTHEKNFRGFNAVDATILTSFAKYYERMGHLTRRQTDLARKKIVKYTGQLLEVANSGR